MTNVRKIHQRQYEIGIAIGALREELLEYAAKFGELITEKFDDEDKECVFEFNNIGITNIAREVFLSDGLTPQTEWEPILYFIDKKIVEGRIKRQEIPVVTIGEFVDCSYVQLLEIVEGFDNFLHELQEKLEIYFPDEMMIL